MITSFYTYSQGTIRSSTVFVPDKNTNFLSNLNAGMLVFELDSNKIYKLTTGYLSTDDMAKVFTDGNYVVIAGGEVWKDYGSYIYPPGVETIDIPSTLRHHAHPNSVIEFVEGDILVRAVVNARFGRHNGSYIVFTETDDSVCVKIGSTYILNTTMNADSITFYQDIFYPNASKGAATDSIITFNASTKKFGYVKPDRLGLGTMSNVVEDLTPQLGGSLDLNDKAITTEASAGENLVAGDLCYFKNSDGEMYLADADAESTSGNMLLLCLETLTDGNSGTFLYRGVYTTTGLTKGVQYVSNTAGDFVGVKPIGSGDIIRIVGYIISSTQFFFDPSQYYEIIP